CSLTSRGRVEAAGRLARCRARLPNSTDAPTRFGTRMYVMTSMRERGFRRRRRCRLPLLACGVLLAAAAAVGRAQTDPPPEPLELPAPPVWPDLERSPDGAGPDSAMPAGQDDAAAADSSGAVADTVDPADAVDPAEAVDPGAEGSEP